MPSRPTRRHQTRQLIDIDGAAGRCRYAIAAGGVNCRARRSWWKGE